MGKHKYTETEQKFIKEYAPGHTYKEIVEAYNKTFREPITISRLKSYIGLHKIKCGVNSGRFSKGHIPFNKGQKGKCAPGSEKSWFKKGHFPHNTKPMGDERVSKDGYIEVKVRERKTGDKPNTYEAKHREIWRREHGEIPKGYIVSFLDGNNQNCDIDNLVLLSRAEHLELTRRNLRSENPQLTETGVLIAKTGIAIKKAKKKVN